MNALRLVRRALALPPGEALRGAQRLALMRGSELWLRVQDLGGADPLAEGAAARRLGLVGAADRAAFVAKLFGQESVLPVRCPADPPPLDADTLERVRFAARLALEHRFPLLGGGAAPVDYGLVAPGLEGRVYRMAPGSRAAAAQLARMERLLPGSTRGGAYEPIDWHVDSISGYRWDPKTWYRGISYGVVPGADVKVPWELSRLQHVGALGLAWRYAPGTREGAAAPQEFVSQVVDWLAANPVRRGVSWACTMDVALRAVSWLTGVALLDGATALTAEFRWLLARAIHLHGEHIERNLEYDPARAGNHYLADVLGLVAIGAACPEAPAADRWLAYGLQETASEARREILPDGADLEGSTAYHAFVLEMFLAATAIAVRLPKPRLERLLRAWPAGPRLGAPALRPLEEQELDIADPAVFPPDHYERLAAAAELLAELTDERGLLPQVGDHDSGRVFKLAPDLVPVADHGFAEEPRDWRQPLALAGALLARPDLAASADRYALNAALVVPAPAGERVLPSASVRRLGAPGGRDGTLALFPEGGLAVARRGDLRLVATFARVPPAGTGGHHHNDLLAFEVSWRGVPLVVDGGSYLYTCLPDVRDEFRCTNAHSTIAVQGREQRRWPGAGVSLFMVTGDADVALLAAEPGRMGLECRYQGVIHRRTFTWTDCALVVEDYVHADAPASLVLNLAPDVTVESPPVPEGDVVACDFAAGGVRGRLRIAGVGDVQVRGGCYSIGYGRRLQNQRVVARLAGTNARTEIRFEALGGRGA